MSTEGLTRREWLATTASAAALTGCRAKPVEPRVVGADFELGHRVREGKFPAPSATKKAKVLIVGAGVAGLAAARHLRKLGVDEVVLCELERQPGGNSQAGTNYPWGAHYLPLPSSESVDTLALLEELGAITGHDAAGLPIYREDYLVADPAERLFHHGDWVEGLIPRLGLSDRDLGQLEAFLARMEELKSARGQDGRRLFAIPVDQSSQDADWLALDQMTMQAWMAREGYTAEALLWYVDYCCRDDYGAGLSEVSAWVGLHYFAARNASAANAPSHAVLTWPNGNGWLVERLREGLQPIHSRHAVWRIEDQGARLRVDVHDADRASSLRWEAEVVIYAAPRFSASKVIVGLPPAQGLIYSPWMVANLFLSTAPKAGKGAPLSWDNVNYKGQGLGYVVATHQKLQAVPQETVFTYYQTLPRSERHQMLTRSPRQWMKAVLDDLRVPHPDLMDKLSDFQIWLWGHGMITPSPGFLWGETRRSMQTPHGRILFAHSDMSGISIFEEAYSRGLRAAEAAVPMLGT